MCIRDRSREEIQSYLGLRRSTEFNNIPRVSYRHLLEFTVIPVYWDSRTQWSNCVHEIRDQQNCGSCWAFGASDAFSNRLCVASYGRTNIILSPQYSVACDRNNNGCQGGYLDKAWQFFERTGLPSDACVPYTAGTGDEGKCPNKCVNGSDLVLHKTRDVRTYETIKDAKIDILANGPAETSFDVYEDFMSYAGGIYSYIGGRLLGGHAVKIVGWGQERGVNYWIAANSWGNDWGEDGYFRIQEGECAFGDQIIAGIPVI
eukprot:TRINITY_DN656_c0_g2_i1.p1 TRINITY_DN656_c0_g2~~TRINITY_DN656_c0_g2_i1.p1  ORF type:complete len:260 (-),score=65.88 TRINITY_DN656_c0_g2_i1:134-913(-)